MIKIEKAFEDQDIVEKLLIRADIRRAIRKENDRIAELCEEAANEIQYLRAEKLELQAKLRGLVQ